MIIIVAETATSDDIDGITAAVGEMGCRGVRLQGVRRTAVGVVGNAAAVDDARISALRGVAQVIRISPPYKQASREWRPEDTVIELANGTRIGGGGLVVIGGPASAESEAGFLDAARSLGAAGVTVLSAATLFPNVPPYPSREPRTCALELLDRVRAETGMAILVAVADHAAVDRVAEHVDIIQIGAGDMQNFSLLRHAARVGKPVLLRRGTIATIEELLMAAEYVLAEGNGKVILCECGVSGFGSDARELLDITAIPVLRSLSHLPVVADPCRGTEADHAVIAMSKAAVAAGADGLMLTLASSAPQPGAQHHLSPESLGELLGQAGAVAAAMGRLAPSDSRSEAAPRPLRQYGTIS